MSKWDETYWDYESLSPTQNNFAAALSKEWHSVDAVSLRTKQDTNRRKLNGKTRWEHLVILGIADVDTSRKDGVFLRRGLEWETWWKANSLTHSLQMLNHGATLEDIGLI